MLMKPSLVLSVIFPLICHLLIDLLLEPKYVQFCTHFMSYPLYRAIKKRPISQALIQFMAAAKSTQCCNINNADSFHISPAQPLGLAVSVFRQKETLNFDCVKSDLYGDS